MIKFVALLFPIVTFFSDGFEFFEYHDTCFSSGGVG